MLKQILKLYNANKSVFFLQILDKLFFFALFWTIAYMFSVNEYGKVVVAFSVSNMLFYMLQFGIPVHLQNKSAKYEKIDFSDVVTAIRYGLIIFLASNIMIVVIMNFMYDEYSFLLLLINSFVFSYYFISIFNSLLLGRRVQAFQFKVFLLIRIILIIILISLLFYTANLILLLFICFLGNIIIAALLYLKVSKVYYYKNKKIFVTFSKYKILLSTSLPIGLASMANYIYDKLDTIIISKILNIDQAAYYNISYGIFKTSQLLFSFILVAGFTRVSYLSKRTSAVIIFFKKYFIFITTISTVIFVLLILFSETLIINIYGEKYRNSVILLQLLALSLIPVALNNLTGITLNGLGLYKTNLKIVCTALFLNIFSNLLLVYYLGVSGAIVSTFITELFILVAGLIILKNSIK